MQKIQDLSNSKIEQVFTGKSFQTLYSNFVTGISISFLLLLSLSLSLFLSNNLVIVFVFDYHQIQLQNIYIRRR